MADYFLGNDEYFKGIGKVAYEGSKSDNPLSFKFFDAGKVIGRKTMAEHLDSQLLTGIHFAGTARILSEVLRRFSPGMMRIQ